MSAAQRVALWLVCISTGIGLSYFIAFFEMSDAPHALRIGIGIPLGVALAWILSALGKAQRDAFTAAYLGDAVRARELLATRRNIPASRDVDPFSSAALEVTAGLLPQAQSRLDAIRTGFGTGAAAHDLVQAHLHLLHGGHPDLVDRLLAVPRQRMRAVERYRLSLIARAALAGGDPASVARAETALLVHRDREAHAFAQWLRASLGRDLEALDREEDARRGSELASVHGHPALAHQLQDRATAIERALAATTPYRK